ncbi:Leucine-rich repeat protein kinase family protein [Rhynchospora pubera]|uniref:non-specific serine/threonine protein kinase n=1 Tax=Rhynchospora pubera TaxID=906938 RepID=A0AAV8F7D9_9POAL|nr:Leucine-rich repeat protein kinase family protein [Rhynchospora pubera]
MYGDYDGLNKPPIFDLYIGVNFWRRVNISDASKLYIAEVITVVTNSYIQVCLLDKGQGTPFISSLDLRPLKSSLYPAVANASVSMSLHRRLNAGVDDSVLVRYPADPHDRMWEPFNNPGDWTQVNTTSSVQNPPNDMYEPPSAVMQTGSSNDPGYQIRFYWLIEAEYKSPSYFVVLYFAELLEPPPPNPPSPDPKKQPKKGSDSTGNDTKQFREFTISINGYDWYASPVVPQYLMTSEVYGYTQTTTYSQYNLMLEPTDNATLAPLLNAVEIFVVLPTADLPTDSGDFIAIMAIRERYILKKNWTGDPCYPKVLLWNEVTCNYGIATPPRVIALNLSSGGLTGGIATYFANFTELQSLDLSHNNLTGPIPDFLALLPSLTFLDLSSNQLSGAVPSALQKKSQDGTLTLRVSDNGSTGPAPLSGSSPSSSNSTASPSGFTSAKKSNTSGVIGGVTVTVIVISLAVLLIVIRRRRQHNAYVRPQASTAKGNYDDDTSLNFDNRQFTYKELKKITNDFEKDIGKGGFGTVYLGYLEDGTPVAVKMRSQSAAQGIKEFLGEAQHLIRVHHRNLVSLIGYCKDGEYSALVYEYMSEGTLQDKLRGPAAEAKPMNWRNRLRIGLESAQGLEYLHKACKPPLIHRDVKTNNILLNSKLEAKIADFGLSKAFNNDIHSHISTAVVGTPGYLDPEYYTSFQLSEKSDVFSFGVVLLELVTGQPPIIAGPEGGHVVQWVRQRLSKGDIEDVVDTKMQGEYDVNSVWKVAELALKCVSHASSQRPTMPDVVDELKECMELEAVNEKGYNSNPSSTTSFEYSRNDNAFMYPSGTGEISQTYDIGHFGRVDLVSGPAAR